MSNAGKTPKGHATLREADLPDFVWPHAAREARGAAAKLPPHRLMIIEWAATPGKCRPGNLWQEVYTAPTSSSTTPFHLFNLLSARSLLSHRDHRRCCARRAIRACLPFHILYKNGPFHILYKMNVLLLCEDSLVVHVEPPSLHFARTYSESLTRALRARSVHLTTNQVPGAYASCTSGCFACAAK